MKVSTDSGCLYLPPESSGSSQCNETVWNVFAVTLNARAAEGADGAAVEIERNGALCSPAPNCAYSLLVSCVPECKYI